MAKTWGEILENWISITAITMAQISLQPTKADRIKDSELEF